MKLSAVKIRHEKNLCIRKNIRCHDPGGHLNVRIILLSTSVRFGERVGDEKFVFLMS
jgi:hypothetical protein